MADGEHRVCQVCEADITPEQINKREAGLLKGVLHCPKCVQAKRQAAAAAAAPVGAGIASSGAARPAAPVAEEPLTLMGSDDGAAQPSSVVRAVGGVGTKDERQYKRPLAGKNEGATRCRTFHAKLAAGAIVYLDDQINEWIDGHPEVFIKTVSTTVGLFEGKHQEPHLMVTIFY
jgi:hypothetical protein